MLVQQNSYLNYQMHLNTLTDDTIIDILRHKPKLFQKISNPSDLVIMTAIDLDRTNFFHLKNPSKNIIKHMLYKNMDAIDFFPNVFTSDELINLIELNPFVIKYISNPSPDICIKVIQLIFNDQTKYSGPVLKYLTYINQEMVDQIIQIKFLLDEFNYIPAKYLTDQIIIKAIYTNHNVMKFISEKYLNQTICTDIFNLNVNSFRFIPEKFKTDNMINCIYANKHYHLVEYIESLSQEICDKIFNENPENFCYIPKHFRSKQVSQYIVKINHNLLDDCEHIDDDILSQIFKSQPKVPKVDRFLFINNLNEETIIKIISIRPSLLRVVSELKQTDKVICTALNSSGYFLEYVINKTDKYIQLAINNEPKAIKYA